MITRDEILSELDYNPKTGIFVRKVARCNRVKSGERAGWVSRHRKTGYEFRMVRVNGREHLEHRLAWLVMSELPLPDQIDHINQDATDNRWNNLRASNNTKNKKNTSMNRNNTSGITGVTWHKRHKKWTAQVRVDGKYHHLGCFDEDDLDIAAMEVMEFRADNGFDRHHGMEIAHYAELDRLERYGK